MPPAPPPADQNQDRDRVRDAVAARYAGLARAGFAAISVATTHQVADGLHAAIIRAARP
jgi:hypothetical protein